jgi:hypothetical protein
MAQLLPPFTVEQAMIDCGVSDNIVYDGQTQAERISIDIFGDDFQTCMDKTNEELDDDFKDYSSSTVANGQIRLPPATKKNIKAFLQWVKHKYRMNLDPTQERFPVNETNTILQHYKTHKAYVDKSKTISDTATPSQFTDKTKWSDWLPTLRNFLRAIPGRNGVPLSYIIRDDNIMPRDEPHASFLDDYIDLAPLEGVVFITDAAEVHTYIVKFIAENDTAESKIQSLMAENNGRQDFIALQEHYEGVGVNALDVTRADRILETLFYSGEKRPNMWWGLFERTLNEAFTIYNRKEGREVHSEHMKLRILCKKITADFLTTAKATVQLELAKVPLVIMYNEALISFRNQVNLKFPPELSAQNNRNRARRLAKLNRSGDGGRGRGRGRFGRGRGRGRGGRFHRNGGRHHGGRGNNNGSRRSRSDSRMVRCSDGTEVEVHASFQFDDNVWFSLPEVERNRIIQERQAYKRQRYGGGDDRTAISQITTGTNVPDLQSVSNTVQAMQQQISSIQSQQNEQQTSDNPPSSIMGGRNEQASLRTRNNN